MDSVPYAEHKSKVCMRGRRLRKKASRGGASMAPETGGRAEEGGGDYQDGLHLGLEEEGEQGRHVARR